MNNPEHIPLIVRESPHRAAIIDCYRRNFHHIRTNHVRFQNSNAIYNFMLRGRPLSENILTRTVFNTQRHAFRSNASVGGILLNPTTGETRFLYTCFNNLGILNNTPRIVTRQDYLDGLAAIDYSSEVTSQRDST